MGTASSATLERYSREQLVSREWRLVKGSEWLRESGALQLVKRVTFDEYAALDHEKLVVSLKSGLWRKLLRESVPKEHIEKVCAALAARRRCDDREDHSHEDHDFEKRGVSSAAVAALLLFFEDPVDAFWLLVRVVERPTENLACDLNVLQHLLSLLPYASREAYDERVQTAEVISMKMAAAKLVDVTEPELTIALWDSLFCGRDYSKILCCCVAAQIEVVARSKAIEKCKEPLLKAVLHSFKEGFPLASFGDVDDTFKTLSLSQDDDVKKAPAKNELSRKKKEMTERLDSLFYLYERNGRIDKSTKMILAIDACDRAPMDLLRRLEAFDDPLSRDDWFLAVTSSSALTDDVLLRYTKERASEKPSTADASTEPPTPSSTKVPSLQESDFSSSLEARSAALRNWKTKSGDNKEHAIVDEPGQRDDDPPPNSSTTEKNATTPASSRRHQPTPGGSAIPLLCLVNCLRQRRR